MAPTYSKLLTKNNAFLAASAVTLIWILKNRRRKKVYPSKRFDS